MARKQIEQYALQPQQYYAFTGSKWRAVDGGDDGKLLPAHSDSQTGLPVTHLRLITWNIDFMAVCPQARMAAALAYLQNLVESLPASTAVVMCLQELTQDQPVPGTVPEISENDEGGEIDELQVTADHTIPTTSDLANDLGQIAAAPWVQERFHVSDLATHHWRVSYNCVTLVDRRLAIAQVSRLPFVSVFNREALLVDVVAARPRTRTGAGPGTRTGPEQATECRVVRICNVHLDSMRDESQLRPIQWRACARYLQDDKAGVVAGILAGDCNANKPSDETVAQENGFTDAYLALGGKEDDVEGHTWGPQSKKTRFPHKRMDKVCFCQNEANYTAPLHLQSLQKIGVGLRVSDEAASKALIEERGVDFVTDHHGLMADFAIGEGWILAVSQFEGLKT